MNKRSKMPYKRGTIDEIVIEHPPVEAYVNEVEAFSQDGCKKPPESFFNEYEEIVNEQAKQDAL